MSTYPLAALSVRSPQQPDVLGTFAQLMQMKDLAQQRRLNEMEMQQRSMTLAGLQREEREKGNWRAAQQAGTRTDVPRFGAEQGPTMQTGFGDVNIGQQAMPLPPGVETNNLAMLQHLGNSDTPYMVPQMQAQQAEQEATQQKALADYRKSLLDMDEAEFKQADRHRQRTADAYAVVMSVPPEQQSAMLQFQVEKLVGEGVLKPEVAQQVLQLPPDKLPLMANAFKDEEQLFKEAEAERLAAHRANQRQAGSSTPDIRNYQFAQLKGYKGSFEQWMAEQKTSQAPSTRVMGGRTRQWNPTTNSWDDAGAGPGSARSSLQERYDLYQRDPEAYRGMFGEPGSRQDQAQAARMLQYFARRRQQVISDWSLGEEEREQELAELEELEQPHLDATMNPAGPESQSPAQFKAGQTVYDKEGNPRKIKRVLPDGRLELE